MVHEKKKRKVFLNLFFCGCCCITKMDEKRYCVCRSPNDFTPMVQCDKCLEWFHFRCVGIDSVHQLKRRNWFCRTCCEKPQKITMSSLIVSRYPSLHREGFTIIQSEVDVPSEMGVLLAKLSTRRFRTKQKVIFNQAPGANDRKRTMLPLEQYSPSIQQYLQQLEQSIRTQIQHSTLLEYRGWSLLHSEPGCLSQTPHVDYVVDEVFQQGFQKMLEDSKQLDLLPLFAIVALMPETSLTIWPFSIGFFLPTHCFARNQAIAPYTVHLREGEILVWRGDLIHAGSKYHKPNTRMHVFLDSPKLARDPSRTWLIRKHAPPTISDLILETT